MHIRPFESADYPGWKALWDRYLRFYHSDVSDAVTQATWQRLTGNDANMFGFSPFDGDNMLGIVHGVLHRSTWLLHYDCYLEDMFVAETARGRGIGRALIEAFAAHARTRQAERIYWLTHKTNTNAQILYDKLAKQSGLIQYRMEISKD